MRTRRLHRRRKRTLEVAAGIDSWQKPRQEFQEWRMTLLRLRLSTSWSKRLSRQRIEYIIRVPQAPRRNTRSRPQGLRHRSFPRDSRWLRKGKWLILR